MKTHIIQTKHQLRHNIRKQDNFKKPKNCMGPLNDENIKYFPKKTTKNHLKS